MNTQIIKAIKIYKINYHSTIKIIKKSNDSRENYIENREEGYRSVRYTKKNKNSKNIL